MRAHLWLFVLPVGAACATLALTVLGLLHVPLAVSVWLVLAAGAICGVLGVRRGPPAPLPRRGADVVVGLAVPLFLAGLVAAIVLLPSWRAGFATVPGQNGDAVLAVGTAELLEHAPPTADRPELPLDQVPVVWRSKLPIYYGLAAVSKLAGQDPVVAFATVGAVVLGLAALGVFLFCLYGLGAPVGAALLALFVVALDRIVVYVGIHPYFNQTWAYFALPFVLLFAARGGAALAALFLALAVFTYPLLLPFPAVFLAVLAWERRGQLDWRGALRLDGLRRRRRLWPLLAVVAVPVVAVLVRGVVEKIVPALDAMRPGGDLSGWSGPALGYLPYGRFVGIDGNAVVVGALVAGVLVAAWLGLRGAPRDVARALAVVLVGAVVAGIYLRARGQAELFWFKDLAFAGPLVLVLAVVGLATRVPRVVGVIALAGLVAVVADGARREITTPYDQVTDGLFHVRSWARRVPADRTIRIDVPPSGWQLWSWYMLPSHRLSVSRPLRDIFPPPPVGRRADLVLVKRPQGRPRDAVGAPVLENPEFALYRLRRGLPGPDVSSRRLVVAITRVTY